MQFLIFTENPTCSWDYILKISDKYDINTRLPFERPFNATNATMLEAGDVVELQCADSTPPRRPNVDQHDDDELDGIIRMFCISPTTTAPDGRYNIGTYHKMETNLIKTYVL